MKNKFSVIRRHEIQAGHKVTGHLGKCANLHGHSYVVYFHCVSYELDDLGMVVDFAIIKSTLCKWLDEHYDHRMLIWDQDPIAQKIKEIDNSVVLVPYNPTAENIANYILNTMAPQILENIPIVVEKVVVEETSNCSVVCEHV